ncbi:hypothetical protein [Robiginitomaculum antarcticum]|uniref:hypothetical protein n=1 Tax=Robiginitomaculum antarcticum TaxID=437507 RepID=UPI00036BD91C|nr:hypothetical protein [Robiginitomaculum antarcticum]
MRARLLILTACLFAMPASAQYTLNGAEDMTLLSGKQLREAFAGKTHYGTYKDAREETGTDSFTEKMGVDGRTDYREGPMRLKGYWDILVDDVMCFEYENFPGRHCFRMYRSGTCIYGYNPRDTTALGPVNANAWSVKSIRKGDVSTCDDLIG